MSTVLITGGTGMIGQAIAEHLLGQGDRVIVFTRDKERQSTNEDLRFAHWDLENLEYDREAIGEADHIISLAGAGIADKRWNKKRKKLIRESRVIGAQLIVRALKETSNNVRSVVSASAIGWYGPDIVKNSDGFVESDLNYSDFLGETCKAWETSIRPVQELGKKLIILRTGIVLSSKGGALERFRQPLRFGMVPILGSGKQVISWIHIDDLVRMYVTALNDPAMGGTYNAVSPTPVTNENFMEILKRVSRSSGIKIKVPAFLLKTVLGEVSGEVLKSARVSPQKIIEAGFRFQFPEVENALRELMEHG